MANDIAYLELLGIPMAGVRRPDQGLYWTDLTGWWGLPDLRGETDNIPGTHGRFRRTQYLRDSRAITLTGHILTEDNYELVATRDRLETALAAGGGLLKVTTSQTGTWERYVEIDTLNIEPDHGRVYTKFTVDMVATDPRRYGPWQQLGPVQLPISQGGVRLPQRMPWNFGSTVAGSTLLVPNSGEIDMYPEIIVEGGFTRLSVYDLTSGARVTLDRPYPAGSLVVFDSAGRRASVDGQDVTRWMTRRQWFKIPPHSEHEIRFEASNPIEQPQMWARFRIGAW